MQQKLTAPPVNLTFKQEMYTSVLQSDEQEHDN